MSTKPKRIKMLLDVKIGEATFHAEGWADDVRPEFMRWVSTVSELARSQTQEAKSKDDDQPNA